jgi:hypothetical protein
MRSIAYAQPPLTPPENKSLEIYLSRQAVEEALLWNEIRIDDIYRLSDNKLSKPVSEALALSKWGGSVPSVILFC